MRISAKDRRKIRRRALKQLLAELRQLYPALIGQPTPTKVRLYQMLITEIKAGRQRQKIQQDNPS